MHLRSALAVPVALAALIAGSLTAATVATAAPGRADPPAKVATSSAQAREALAEARSAMSGAGRGDLTMALRDLWLARDQLTGADRAAANRLLARPGDGNPGWQSRCSADNCYHWTTTGPDAVSTDDVDGDGTPDYIESVMVTVDDVHDAYVAAGYREPKADGAAGGNTKTDIYLEDTHREGAYGYCTTDAPNPPDNGPYGVWAFCVLDNDYDASQFPTNSPLENLQVTAAHEYFHAVQFGYDVYEDRWLMEATATWAEDELFPDVDDNLQYLAESPLVKPGQPLDTFNEAGAQYGTWIFFRFLTEWLDDAEGGLPTLVRDIWRRADGDADGPDDYSVQALSRVLAQRDVSLTNAFALFATANRAPALWYAEGAANRYPSVGPDATVRLTSKRKSGGAEGRLPHLASGTVRFVPSTGLSASAWKLKVTLDLADRATGSAAVVTVYRRTGLPQVTLVPLSSTGAAARKVGFGSAGVRYVEVTMVNAGARYDCWTGGDYSCQGSSKDDGRKVLVRATAVR